MPAKVIPDLGKGGMVYDSPSLMLPQNVFTHVQNMRFRNECAESMGGETVFSTVTNLSPEYGIFWRRTSTSYLIVANDAKIYRITSAGAESMLNNSGSYTNSRWQMDLFNGGYAVIFNNGASTPLYVLETYAGAGADGVATAFPGWIPTGYSAVYAKVIRPLGYSLVAANLTLVETGTGIETYCPSTIRVSVQAGTGSFPDTWTPGLTTDTADEFEINSTSAILDMKELRGTMFVYSSDSIHALTIRNGYSQVAPYASGYGVLGLDCVQEFEGQHFVVDRNSIYTHNGSGGIQLVAEGRMQDYFRDNIDTTYYSKTFVYKNTKFREMWICYVKSGSGATKCNEAIVWNWKSNTWSVRALPNVSYIFSGFNNPGTPGVWDFGDERPYMCLDTTTLLKSESGYQHWNGSQLADFTAYVERQKLHCGDPTAEWQIRSLGMAVDNVTAGKNVTVHLTADNNYDATPDWSNSTSRDQTTFDADATSGAASYKVDPRKSGRFINYRISATGQWRLCMLAVDAVPEGKR